MYLYEISKSFPKTTEENASLIQLLTNAEEVHCMLGRIFNVATEENWRSNYNILYRQSSIAGSWLVQSDIEIDKNAAKKENINYEQKSLKYGNKLQVKLIVSPYKKQDSQKRKYIKTRDERLDWIKLKFADKKACNVISCVEEHSIQTYMAHKDAAKGCETLRGYEYTIDIDILDKNQFDDIVKCGIGPSKSYGFGMVSVV